MIISIETQSILNQKLSGVYIFINLINGHMYIGGAINLYARQRRHTWELTTNRHCNQHFQRAFNKYSTNNFKFDIIELTSPDRKIICEREQYWINFYNTCDRAIGYNIVKDVLSPGKSLKGIKKPAWYGEYKSKELSEKFGIEYCLKSPQGEIIQGKGLGALCKKFNIPFTSIRRVIKGELDHCHGWRLPDTEIKDFEYKFKDPYGKIIRIPFGKLHDYCKNLGTITTGGLFNVWNGTAKYCRGYTRYDVDLHYKFKNPNAEIIEIGKGFLKDFCKLNNLNAKCMDRVIHGQNKQHNGWTRA